MIFNSELRKIKKLFISNMINSLRYDYSYWIKEKNKIFTKYNSTDYETENINNRYIKYYITNYGLFYLIEIKNYDKLIKKFIIFFNFKFSKSYINMIKIHKKDIINKKYEILYKCANHNTRNKPSITDIRKDKLENII